MSFQYPDSKIPASQNPAPNTFPAELVHREIADLPNVPQQNIDREIRRTVVKVLNNFWKDMGNTCASAMLQNVTDCRSTKYADKARANRERIAELQRIESARKDRCMESQKYDIGEV